MPQAFGVRGVVEGFYGTPWSHADRLDVLSFIGEHGMNAYVYAPKDDPRHRARWREPYDAAEQRRFEELVSHAVAAGVRFGFAISPGLDIAYESGADRATLYDKLAPLRDAGVAWFLVMFDDIPMRPGLAVRQSEVVAGLYEKIPDAELTVCPTEYVGTHPTPYLTDLGASLPAGVGVMWTGPTVCSPAIGADDARAWSASVGGRRPLLWDNYPVNDGPMAHALHLGPYRGRDPALAGIVAGVLCNPMTQPHASKVALATAARFLADPDGYDPDAAWSDAIDAVGGDRAGALASLAAACADGPLAAPSTLPLAATVDRLEAAAAGPDWAEPLAAVASALRAARRAPDGFAASGTGDPLAAEVAPWAAALRLEAEAGLAAARLLQRLRPVAGRAGGGSGRAAPVDPTLAMHAAFGMLFSWAVARTNNVVVFGPRFAIYPAVVQLVDGSPGIDPALALREDANVIDRLCRLALADYERWRRHHDVGGHAVRAFVDGEERPIAESGAFDAHGSDIVLRDGRTETRVVRGARLPFREPRLP